MTGRLLAARAGGDVDALLAALAPGAVLVTDGGGRAEAALRPIVGAGKVARFLAATTAAGLSEPGLEVRIADVNGLPDIVVRQDGRPLLAASLVVVDGLASRSWSSATPTSSAGRPTPPRRAT